MNSFAQQPPRQLQLADHRHAALARRGDHRRLRRHARALDHRAARRSSRASPSLARCTLHAGVAQRLGARRRAGVDADHLLAARAQRQRRRDARAREADDEVAGRGRDVRAASSQPSADALPVDREADRAADRRDDPEAQDDLRLRPRRAARSGGGSAPSGTRVCASSGTRSPGSPPTAPRSRRSRRAGSAAARSWSSRPAPRSRRRAPASRCRP